MVEATDKGNEVIRVLTLQCGLGSACREMCESEPPEKYAQNVHILRFSLFGLLIPLVLVIVLRLLLLVICRGFVVGERF